MRVGDLVTLSAYASKLKMFKHLKNKVGLLTSLRHQHIDSYLVLWQGHKSVFDMQRKDIKRAK
jgi:hypothetical protein